MVWKRTLSSSSWPYKSSFQASSKHNQNVTNTQYAPLALLIVRTFALYEGNRRVLALLLGVVCVALAIAFVGHRQPIIASIDSDPSFQWLVISAKKTGLEEHFAVVGCLLAISRSK